jgi:hypothetical protein
MGLGKVCIYVSELEIMGKNTTLDGACMFWKLYLACRLQKYEVISISYERTSLHENIRNEIVLTLAGVFFTAEMKISNKSQY